mmetsp:Transcript_1730/g.3341  ORF Transcript_1730/g.3341 Transcript_1730/m.3341 type:complete len:193 (+) Transcript_1730:276-854(+)
MKTLFDLCMQFDPEERNDAPELLQIIIKEHGAALDGQSIRMGTELFSRLKSTSHTKAGGSRVVHYDKESEYNERLADSPYKDDEERRNLKTKLSESVDRKSITGSPKQRRFSKRGTSGESAWSVTGSVTGRTLSRTSPLLTSSMSKDRTNNLITKSGRETPVIEGGRPVDSPAVLRRLVDRKEEDEYPYMDA